MDPNVTLVDFIEAIAAGFDEDRKESGYNLRTWLMAGGFPPDLGKLSAVQQKLLVRYLVDREV